MNNAILSGNWTDNHVRNAVLQLLKEMNQCTLAKLSPLSQPMISNILNSKYAGKMGIEKCKEFGLWYVKYREQHKAVEEFEGWPKTTRLTFHPAQEIPKLRQWYQTWKNPSDAILNQLLLEVNNGPVRKERAKVTLQKLKMWWKNEKQRLKRIQSQEPNFTQTKSKQRRRSSQREEESVSVQGSDSEHSLLDISGPVVSYVQTDPMFCSTFSVIPHKNNSTSSSTSSSPTSKTLLPPSLPTSSSSFHPMKSPDRFDAAALSPTRLPAEDHQKQIATDRETVMRLAVSCAQEATSQIGYLSRSHTIHRPDPTTSGLPAAFPPHSNLSPPFLHVHPAHVKLEDVNFHTAESMPPQVGVYSPCVTGPHSQRGQAGIMGTKKPMHGLPVFPGPELRKKSPNTLSAPRGKSHMN